MQVGDIEMVCVIEPDEERQVSALLALDRWMERRSAGQPMPPNVSDSTMVACEIEQAA